MPLLARSPLMMMTFITQGGEGRSPVPEKLTSARDDRAGVRPSFGPRHDTIPYQFKHSKTRHAQEKSYTGQVMHRTKHSRTSESMDPIATY